MSNVHLKLIWFQRMDESMQSLIKEKHLKELDPSQKDAYLHALENKVAIIQG